MRRRQPISLKVCLPLKRMIPSPVMTPTRPSDEFGMPRISFRSRFASSAERSTNDRNLPVAYSVHDPP